MIEFLWLPQNRLSNPLHYSLQESQCTSKELRVLYTTTGSNSPSTSRAMGRLFPLQPLPGTKERWGNETSDQFEEPQRVCCSGTFQNGGATSSELPAPTRGLVHKSGSEGRLLSCPDSPQPTEIPEVHVGGNNVPVHLSPIWLVFSTKDIHQTDEAYTGSARYALLNP